MISPAGSAAKTVLAKSDVRPMCAIVLGSGLAAAADKINAVTQIPYKLIPGWPAPTVPGHPGELILGSLAGVPVAVLRGRVHLYEGYSASEVTFGVRVAAGLGVRRIVFTNAAGAVNPEYQPGSIALVSDHINLQGTSPLVGREATAGSPRFIDLTDAYSPRLRKLAHHAAGAVNIKLREGVYAGVLGPNYETPAEIRFLRTLGADLVGMSTIQEVIAARQANIEVLGLSCVTNMAAGVTRQTLSHEHVLDTGAGAVDSLARLLERLLPDTSPG